MDRLAKSPRIESIDLLRGLVMVIMVLDHVRDFFHQGAFAYDATDLSQVSGELFLTRWITHFCAPVFVFLSGTSAFLYGQKTQSKGALSRFLLTRGLWLIVLELTVVNFAWSFDPSLQWHNFQVIWAIGVSMIALAGLIWLPYQAILGIGALMVLGHNALDGYHVAGNGAWAWAWRFLHDGGFVPLSPTQLMGIMYPLIPWIGVMALGYLFGNLYAKGTDPEYRRKWLLRIGVGALILFLILRIPNLYGDPNPWTSQDSPLFSFFSLINVNKYPPSLDFLLLTLGPAMLLLYLTENARNGLSRIFVTIGRVPLFWYVVHLYVAHLAAWVMILMQGGEAAHVQWTPANFVNGSLTLYGIPLGAVYLVWIGICVALYFPSRAYAAYKARNRDKWWLSYL